MAAYMAIAVALLASAAVAAPSVDVAALRDTVLKSEVVQEKIAKTCKVHTKVPQCEERAADALFCKLLERSHPDLAAAHCAVNAQAKPAKPVFLQVASQQAPEDELAKEMTHDLEMNFNKIAPFGKEDTAKELQDHAAKTQDTLVDAVENAEVAEIKRAVFRALTRLRAATIKEFDTIARLETQAIDAYNDVERVSFTVAPRGTFHQKDETTTQVGTAFDPKFMYSYQLAWRMAWDLLASRESFGVHNTTPLQDPTHLTCTTGAQLN